MILADRRVARVTAQALIFLHIKKTAGTTLSDIIKRQYPRSSILMFHGEPDDQEFAVQLRNTSDEGLRSIKCVTGHMIFGLHKTLPFSSTYVTLLRDPVDRAISLYYFTKQMSFEPLHNYILENDLSLVDFAQVQANRQTLVLAGKSYGLDQVVTRDDLEVAKSNLVEHFASVGLSERFDESLILLKRLLGWKNVFYARLNQNKQRPPKHGLPPATLKAIEQHNALDLELYAFAEQLLEEQIAAHGAAFERDLRVFKQFSRLLGPALAGYGAARSPLMRKSRAALRQAVARIR